MNKKIEQRKTYCSSADFEKDFFPSLYQERLSLKQGKKSLFSQELTDEFLRSVSQAVAN